MNAIGAFELLCPYPKATDLNIALDGYYFASSEDDDKLPVQGLVKLDNTQDWNAPCGSSCPVVLRRLSTLEGFGRLAWGGYQKDFQNRGALGTDFSVNVAWRRGMFYQHSLL